MGLLDRFFKLKENHTNFKTEALAGFTIFLTMLYIIPVGSQILSAAGMPKNELITAISLVTALATLLTGIWANTPVAMSVGMGLNAYFTYGLVGGMGLSWQQALGAVFLSGVIFLIISLTRLRVWIMQSIPKDLRFALCAGLGAFIATIGFKSLGFITITPSGLMTLGNLTSPQVLIGIFGVLLMLLLHTFGVQGAFIIGILACSAISWIIGLAVMPTQIISLPASISGIAFQFDLIGIFNIAIIPAIVALLITDLFDSLGTLAGVGAKAKMFQDTSGRDKKLEKTLQIDALATTGGAMFGLSTTTAFLESSAGVASGGRTGLTAVFCALFFALTLFFLPIFNAIPEYAIYPTLIVVGALMFAEVRHIDFTDIPTATASFFTIILMPLSSSITTGLASGFIVYVLMCAFKREWQRLNLGVMILFAISLIPFVFQH
ncbi:NCS2 family permease [Helicobacter sp. 11S02596-1]|uniref:NCS2 family permease n=1 Tax=Helicobacter sp. 11S02596-1 TaxID=1476194 RepID=UPI000BA72F7C|nr:NCS2 family permease [Helicobacter sp. 11S02596-1]PAF43965.1 guanine permease [Helicobacter sp. 11S02596-1]